MMTHFNYNGNGPVVNEADIESFTYKVINCSTFPLWMVDGSTQQVIYLPPILQEGKIYKNVPAECIGQVMVVATRLTEMKGVHNWVYQWRQIIATPPINPHEIQKYTQQIQEYNFVIFGNEEDAAAFFNTYGSYYRYIMGTDFGTRFANSANYGILNCTGRVLYQVDDSGIEDTGQADIIEIPPGNDTPLPLWDAQAWNTKYNVRKGKPYVRAYRYTMIPEEGHQYRGFMREHVYDWVSENLPDGFLYIPHKQMCLFEDRHLAEEFIKEYKSVERYHTILTMKRIDDDLAKKYDAHYTENELKHRRIMTACAITISLQIAGEVGKVLMEVVKQKHRQNNRNPQR